MVEPPSAVFQRHRQRRPTRLLPVQQPSISPCWCNAGTHATQQHASAHASQQQHTAFAALLAASMRAFSCDDRGVTDHSTMIEKLLAFKTGIIEPKFQEIAQMFATIDGKLDKK